MKKVLILHALIMTGLCLFAQIPINGLIAHYPFNSNSNDESGNNFNGINHGATLTTDRFGSPYSAYYFNGLNSYIDLGTVENFMRSNISVCCWFSTDYKDNKIMQILRLRNYGYSISLYNKEIPTPNGLLISYYTGNGKNTVLYDQSNQDYTDGLWHFVAFTYDSINGKLYIDNKLISSKTENTKSPLFYTNGGIAIGRDGDNSGYYFKGKIDDIKLYNRPLNQLELTNLYYEGICRQSVAVSDTLMINLNITNFNPLTYKNTFKIYPNPTNNSLTIDCGNNFENIKNYSIKITNNLGQTVHESTITEQKNNINLLNWTGKGIYYLSIIATDKSIIETKKIVLN